MEAVRQIINSSLLSDIINLPDNLKNKKIEITILPFEEINDEIVKNNSVVKKRTIESLVGVASKYAKHDLPIDVIIQKEKEAWAEAVADKYGYNN